ncbi:hypothetical protein ACJMK2_001509, partial [Sinanodonta woodiana]
RRKPDYRGCVVMDDMLIAIDGFESYLHVYNLHVGKRITSHRLEDWPLDVCLINKTEVAVRLGWRGKVVILSLTSRDGVKLVNTLQTGLYLCDSLVKWRSDKLVISGKKKDDMLCWGILSLTDGRLDSTHDICKGYGTRMDVREDTVYISCRTRHSIANGVHAFNLLTNKQKFVYQHRELISPESIMADRDYVYVCDRHYNKIHQLTDSGQLVTIHPVSSRPWSMFYDDQQGLIYTTSEDSIVITVYKMESSRQEDSVIPAEVLKMDTGSLHIYKNALCDGYEKVYNIRVMVVGQYGVGKTTLTQRLLGNNVNISERHSTEGIDVHVECSKVSLLSGEWTTQEKNADKYSQLQRLVRLLNEHFNKQELKRGQDRQSELDDQVISLEYDNSHTQHNLLVSKEQPQQDKPVSVEPSTNQIVKETSSQPVESSIVRLHPESSGGIHSKGNEKDTVMEILKQVNETSGKLEIDGMQYAALSLWDFAGQYSFYTTHQTFLTSRAIYLLVIDLSQQVTDLIGENECFLDAKGKQLCNIPEMMEIWLNMIHSCASSSDPGSPPVILVGTHVDKIPEENRQKVIDQYFIKIREMLKSKPIVFHLIDNIAIDNSLKQDPRLEHLKKRIFELSSQQKHWGEEKPARWLPLEHAIMTIKASGVKVASFSLIEEINMSSSIKIEERDELIVFLTFQHEIGTILYFNADGLKDMIVLDPQWMIDALKSLITDRTFIEKNPTVTKEWYAFNNKGKLTHELIDAIWTKKDKPDFHDNKEYLIRVMEKLNIIAKPMSYTLDGKSVKEEDYYLAPCILRQETPKEMVCPVSDPEQERTSVLCFVCKGKFLPPPIFHRLVGACLMHWPIAKQNGENLIYCGCCLFDIDEYHRLTLHFLGHVIFVRVTIIADISQSSKVCSEARKLIHENLSKITKNLGQSLEFEPHIQCPDCNADNLEGMISVPRLQKEKVVCKAHVKPHTLVSRQLLKFWFEDGEQKEGKGFKEEETKEKPEKMPSASITKGPSVDDTDRFMHIACLLVNVGSKVLRRLLLFHTVTPTCTLDQYLANKRIDLDNLRKKRILNKSQMDILFPPSGITSLGDYDITLLSALFTNIVPNISQQHLDMIHYLRDKRNEIFAHAPSVAVNLNNYQTFWNDIYTRLEALSKQCNDPDFEKEISKEIQGIQGSTFQDKWLQDILQSLSGRMENIEMILQNFISSPKIK